MLTWLGAARTRRRCEHRGTDLQACTPRSAGNQMKKSGWKTQLFMLCMHTRISTPWPAKPSHRINSLSKRQNKAQLLVSHRYLLHFWASYSAVHFRVSSFGLLIYVTEWAHRPIMDKPLAARNHLYTKTDLEHNSIESEKQGNYVSC